jgi:hypothetical protein
LGGTRKEAEHDYLDLDFVCRTVTGAGRGFPQIAPPGLARDPLAHLHGDIITRACLKFTVVHLPQLRFEILYQRSAIAARPLSALQREFQRLQSASQPAAVGTLPRLSDF